MEPFGGGMGGLRLDDVALEGETPDGKAVVDHLSVIVDAAGITVLGPAPGASRTLGWDRMSSVELGPTSALPGEQAVNSLQFVLDGRPLRFLLPAYVTPPPAAVAPTVTDSPAPVAPVPAAGLASGAPDDGAEHAPVADPNVDLSLIHI